MKKLSYILSALLLFASVGLFSSCGDNDNFTNLHVLTQDELDEMARQQRIADSLKQVINADLILSYVVEDYPLTGWNDNELKIETDKIAALFGLTEEEVIAGINQEAGAPDITGFAIQGSTHADVASSSNTNGTWGHWWDKEGNVCNSYNQEEPSPSAFYCEWHGELFGVGQFPGHLVAGDEITVLEGLKYQDLRVVCAITFRCVERGEVTGGVVGEQILTLTTPANDSYETVPVPDFDAEKVLSDLGASSWDDVSWVCLNADGSYAQEYNADPHPGFWFDKLGYYGAWGPDASVFVLFNAEQQTLLVGQMPEQMPAGSTVTLEFDAIVGEKIERIELTINTTEAQAVEGGVVGTQTLTLNTPTNDEYATVPVPGFDAQKVLSDLGVSSWNDVKWITTDAEGNYVDGYNADPAPGYWFDKSGYKGAWGADASVFVLFNADEQALLVGQMPEQMPAGSTVTLEFDAKAGDNIEKIVITVNTTEPVAYEDPETAPEGTPESIEKDITLTKTWDNEWKPTEEIDVKEDLRQCFKMTTYQIFSALRSGEMNMWVDEVGKDAAEDGTPWYTADAPGYWLGAEGQRVVWGEQAIVFLDLDITEESLAFFSGNHPDNCPADGLTVKTKIILEKDGITATYNVTIDITAAAAARRR